MPHRHERVVSIVLGGGRGSRLQPLTDKRAKPAVPIGGKYRLVDIPISNCINSGYNKIFVLTQFNSASLNKHIKNTYNFSLFSNGHVDILAAEQTISDENWFEGTADAVRRMKNHLDQEEYDYILILSGDHLYNMDYSKMLNFHVENGGDITIGTIPVTADDAPGFGILKSNEENQIVSFVEKPNKDELVDWKSHVSEDLQNQGKDYLASMGIYIFSKEVLMKRLDDNPGNDFGKEIIPDSLGDYNLLSYPFDSYWADIGSVRSFFDANIGLTEDVPEFNLFGDTIFTHARMLPPSKMSGTTIEKAIVADGCIISAEKIISSIIGVRSRIGKGTIIKCTYMMGSTNYQDIDEVVELTKSQAPPPMGVGERCYIANAILDKNCRIGNDVRIQGGPHLKEDEEHENYAIKDGIIIIKKGAVIPPGSNIGL